MRNPLSIQPNHQTISYDIQLEGRNQSKKCQELFSLPKVNMPTTHGVMQQCTASSFSKEWHTNMHMLFLSKGVIFETFF